MAEDLAAAGETASISECQEALEEFWPHMLESVRQMSMEDFKCQDLPLARIKKIMKLDDDVKMISAEAPLLFAKAAELFIHELTLRAWVHTEDNKRRTLQRNDIAMALARCDQFDFLIDIVPREEIKTVSRQTDTKTGVLPDQVQYYFQLAQQQQAALQQQQQQQAAVVATPAQQSTQLHHAQAQQQQQLQSIQIISGGQVQTIQIIPAASSASVSSQATVSAASSASGSSTAATTNNTASNNASNNAAAVGGAGVQTIHLQVNAQGQLVAPPQPQPPPPPPPQPAVQLIQQVVGADGQVHQVPLQLSSSQLQMLRMASQSGGATSGSSTAAASAQQTVVLQPHQAQQLFQGQQMIINQQE